MAARSSSSDRDVECTEMAVGLLPKGCVSLRLCELDSRLRINFRKFLLMMPVSLCEGCISAICAPQLAAVATLVKVA